MRWLLLLLLSLAAMAETAPSAAAAPYRGYNYSFWGDVTPAPNAYLPSFQLDGDRLGAGPLQSPEDLFITPAGMIYIADTRNNRIVVFNDEFNLVRVIDKFDHNGKEDALAEPHGVFVKDDSRLFVADTGNARIVELTTEGAFVREIGAPDSDVLRSSLRYVPVKLVVDSANRMYVVSKGVFDGIMQFDSGGKFTGFIGTNKVTFNPIDMFWRRLMTEEQRSKMALNIPEEFNNVDIDAEGFIYTTTAEGFTDEPVKRLNPSGVDVLKRDGYFPPKGDIWITFNGTRIGPSSMIAVAVDRNGIYSILDGKRGRVFTYDRDGKLMYAFGQLGEQLGGFRTPSDIAMLGEKVVVLDKGIGSLVIFEPTRYGRMIRNAVIYTDNGEEEKAVAAWKEAQKLNSNLEIAYLGIGKAELRQGSNREAMDSFFNGMHREYYSRAFERYRKDWMWQNFSFIATALLVIAALLLVGRRLVRHRAGEPGTVGMAWYTIFHPFKGFWDLKYERKGKIRFTLALLVLLSVLFLLKQQLSGFIFNPDVTFEASIIDELKFIVLPFFLWCIANWSLTTLMDGEGKFGEIVVATGYALVPIVLAQPLLIVLSNVMTVQEGSFYYFIESVAYGWFIGLLFVGMMTVHQYTVGKTIVTMLLTLVVIGIFVFLGLLVFSLAQQMLSFGMTIYKEISFRIGE
ncbi:YIP1 family protein [Paenibacillus sp. 32O-W]|uniref:YIP1 family protein n=1 Tax=Paenibacillus sp. 32O-W TaxID=1695218 RepID=UPI0007823844|nr:YIP1 family protein [Paenibacillus sp. 32O-W]